MARAELVRNQLVLKALSQRVGRHIASGGTTFLSEDER